LAAPRLFQVDRRTDGDEWMRPVGLFSDGAAPHHRRDPGAEPSAARLQYPIPPSRTNGAGRAFCGAVGRGSHTAQDRHVPEREPRGRAIRATVMSLVSPALLRGRDRLPPAAQPHVVSASSSVTSIGSPARSSSASCAPGSTRTTIAGSNSPSVERPQLSGSLISGSRRPPAICDPLDSRSLAACPRCSRLTGSSAPRCAGLPPAHSRSACASAGLPLLTGSMSCGQLENTMTASISARNTTYCPGFDTVGRYWIPLPGTYCVF